MNLFDVATLAGVGLVMLVCAFTLVMTVQIARYVWVRRRRHREYERRM